MSDYAPLGSTVDRSHLRGSKAPVGGTGLGLSIVAGFAETFGGAAFLDKTMASGSRIGFRLPAVVPRVDP